jgi:hypothetical protein
METPTQEQIQQSISAAFDSVNLINDIISSGPPPLSNEVQDRLDRNIRHLEIMLEKEWFSSNLTTQQRSDIDQALLAQETIDNQEWV